MVLWVDGLTSVTTCTDYFCLCCCVCNKLKGSSRCQRRLATISTVSTIAFTIHSRATAYLLCWNVLGLHYMEVSICCSALYTIGTSQMVEYTLNELTDMHPLYVDTTCCRHSTTNRTNRCVLWRKSSHLPLWPCSGKTVHKRKFCQIKNVFVFTSSIIPETL